MTLIYRKDVSVKVAIFYLKIGGFWFASSPMGKWFRNATIVYSVVAMVFTTWVHVRAIYFSWGDFSAHPPINFPVLRTICSQPSMKLIHRKDVSVSVAIFYLKLGGFWFASNRLEKWLRNATIVYSVVAMVFTTWIHMRAIYFSFDDFSICTYLTCHTVGLVMDLIKILVLYVYKERLLFLIVLMQKNFWHSNYDSHENSIVEHTKRLCIYFVCVFSFLSQSTIASYIIKPIISNIGKNGTDRKFIFDMWYDEVIYLTPYFEIIYVIQALCLYQSGVCYICFDNIFCIMCLHVASQFRILQYRMTNMFNSKSSSMHMEKIERTGSLRASEKYYSILKDCIRQHQDLNEFSAVLEELFSIIILGQVILFSVLICFSGYQVNLANISAPLRICFGFFLMTSISQLWIFTYSCECVSRESLNVATAVYAALWTRIPMNKFGRMIKKDLQFVIMRSWRPCSLTACGFFPISLETFTKIMSTAMSYFAILNQRTVDASDI